MTAERGIRLVGYQVQFEPHAPFQLGRASQGPQAAPDSLLVAHLRPEGVQNVMIVPGAPTEAQALNKVRFGDATNGLWALQVGDSGTRVMLGAGMEDVSAVGKLALGPGTSHWLLETGTYRARWPEGYVVKSADHGAPWPFELHGFGERAGDMIVLRGPLRGAKEVPATPDLVGRGQEIVGQDMASKTPWVELRYSVDGTVWRQRHIYAMPAPEIVVLVTTQAPESRAPKVAADGEAIAQSIQLLS